MLKHRKQLILEKVGKIAPKVKFVLKFCPNLLKINAFVTSLRLISVAMALMYGYII